MDLGPIGEDARSAWGKAVLVIGIAETPCYLSNQKAPITGGLDLDR